MGTSMEYKLGILCGVLVGVILITFLLRWTKKDGSSKCRFDERQQVIRGRGFKYAFFTLIFCDFIYGSLDALLDEIPVDVFAAMALCIIISVVVYACYCIWNEGYFAMNENPKRVLVAFMLIAILNFFVFAREAIPNGIMEDGILAYYCINFVCGVMFLVIFTVLLLRWRQNRKEAE